MNINKKNTKFVLIISIIAITGICLLGLSNFAHAQNTEPVDIEVTFDNFPLSPLHPNTPWAPGSITEEASITVENNEDFDANVYIGAETTGESSMTLAKELTVNIDSQGLSLADLIENNKGAEISPTPKGETKTYDLNVKFNETAGNETQNENLEFNFVVILADEEGWESGETESDSTGVDTTTTNTPAGGGSNGIPRGLLAAATTYALGDINEDGNVDMEDFALLMSLWNQSGEGDLNNSGNTDMEDFAILMSNWSD